MSEITIESIDKILERIPNATYAEAKQALLQCDGNVVEAIILLEDQKNQESSQNKFKKTTEQIFGKDSEEIKAQAMELIRKSSVIRIIIEKNGKTIINLPLTVGVVGIAFGPILTLVGLSAAILSKYKIKIANEDDGNVIDLGELSEEKLTVVKDMLVSAAKDMKDVVSDKKTKSTKDEKDITDELFREMDEEKNDEIIIDLDKKKED